jgi:hypothetical protein
MSYKTKREKELIQQIESSFVDSHLAGDYELVVNPEHFEADELIRNFKGKNWQEIKLKTLYWHRLSLPLFTVEAFRYFLPAFLVVPLRASLHSKYNPSEILEFVFYGLISSSGEPNRTLKLNEIINGLSIEQMSAVENFVKYFLEKNPLHAKFYSEQAKNFWNI